jgi:hypothetical protein
MHFNIHVRGCTEWVKELLNLERICGCEKGSSRVMVEPPGFRLQVCVLSSSLLPRTADGLQCVGSEDD